MRKDEDEDGDIEQRQQWRAERQCYITSQCCEGARRTRAIVLAFDNYDGSPPRWRLRLDGNSSSFGIVDASLHADEHNWYTSGRIAVEPFVPAPTHCPFCGVKLPGVVKKAVAPEPLCRPEDNGEWCTTCKDRGMNCTCWPPEAAYEVTK